MDKIKLNQTERLLLEKELKELAQDLQTYTMYMYSMVPRSEMDLMFIVDCTGSMGSWIATVKNEILAIVKGIKAQFQTSCLRLCFVGYRDLCDPKSRFSIQPFQTDWRSFKTFVSSVKASGGGDTPEDVFGGFKNALEQKWASSAKYAIFIADAPCHGTKYHDVGSDSYPNGDPSGLDMEHFMKEFADKQIHLFSARLNSTQDKMMKIFSDEYKKYMNQDIGQADLSTSAKDFSKFIVKTALQILEKENDQVANQKASMENVYYRVVARMRQNTQFDPKNKLFADKYLEVLQAIKKHQEESEENSKNNLQVEEELDHWKQEVNAEFNFHLKNPNAEKSNISSLIKGFKGLFSSSQDTQGQESQLFASIKASKHTFSVICNDQGKIEWQKPLQFKSEIQPVEIQLALLPFTKGTSNYIYAMEDNKKQRVVRIPIDYYKCSHDIETFIKHNKQQLIAQQIITASGHQSNFNVYELDYQGKRLFVGTEMYQEKNQYGDFNPQLNFQPCHFDKEGLEKQALAHFSYQYTQGQYLIVNYVTGINEKVLLKPLLYSRHFENLPLITNQGYVGIFKFFINHACADECANKQLIDLEEFSDPGKYNFKLPAESCEEVQS